MKAYHYEICDDSAKLVYIKFTLIYIQTKLRIVRT